MKARNPIERSRYIDNRYKEYLKSSFGFGHDELQRLFEERLTGEDLFKGPYLDMSLPFKRGKSLSELITEGVVSGRFHELGGVNIDRPLYAHQERALRQIGAGGGAIVTTGTGSGKTECFLFPILNELMRDLERGNPDSGIRALFLYPMNALVNDQVSRVREILQAFPEITFGFFTGDTPEKATPKLREDYAKDVDAAIPPNEILSRQEIRSNPPHLLFTNYSMLEYMLIRPNDYALFTPERLRNWKFVVLDEAHSYNGSKGIEISYLMRRLTGFAASKPRFILTSATLGQKGKSENDIADFASKLTSTDLKANDIIFADRIPFEHQAVRTLRGEDYLAMSEDIAAVREIAEANGLATRGADDKETLFDVLAGDENVSTMYAVLKGGCKPIGEIAKHFPDLSEDQLTALIDLINAAQKNGIELFGLKYHSFVRPLAGAFVSLGEKPALSFTKSSQINGEKAFEIGNCRYCSTPFLMGRVRHDEANDMDYLLQNDEVDIYENYGRNENASVDFFLLEKTVREEEVDSELLEECVLCTKCAAIRAKGNLVAKECSCEGAPAISVFRVVRKKEDDDTAYNNITQCPCCGRFRADGVIKGLNLGKDETTAILAQTLLESMDSAEEKKSPKKLSLSLGARRKDGDAVDDKVKQFLAFSDSRQQASFFAAFLNANHSRMLRRRLIWKVLEDSGFRTLTAEELEAKLESLIKNGNLFDNDLSPFKNAWVTVLVELLRVDGRNCCEGHGLYHFELDLAPILSQLDDEQVAEAFGAYGFSTIDDLNEILQAVLYNFAVDYNVAGLSPEEHKEYLAYRASFDAVELKSSRSRKGVRSLLPVSGKDNSIVRYVEKIFGCKSDTACEIIETLFNLGVDSGLFVKDESVGAYRIAASSYVLKCNRNSSYHRCSKCGRVTARNVRSVCMSNKCDGVLKPVFPDEEFSRDFYRNQYMTKKVERIVVEEHTAQLDRKTAKRYQTEFKNKRINVLSCSTTFEMGVDIGSLETVFMRNVPPLPANYVQRAGRAGRRSDSAAYVLTYCGANSHDYTYFSAPEKMVNGIINPPYFDVMNQKIIVRHLIAASLGFFFREREEYFESVDSLVFQGGLDEFRKYVSRKPENLVSYLDEKVIPEREYEAFHELRWFDDMGGDDEKIRLFEDAMNQALKEFTEAQSAAKDVDNFDDAKYYADQIKRLRAQRVIDSLSEHRVIPKYGFPVDVVNLEVYESGRRQKQYDLNRDLKIGISDYAPGSEVIVDKKKYTSRYVTLPKGSSLPKRFFCKCPKCEKLNVAATKGLSSSCRYCGESIESQKIDFFLEPVYGFKTGETKQSSFMKPKKTYAGEVNYLGGGVEDGTRLELDNLLTIETTSNDELLVMNKSVFYFCNTCGYGEEAVGLPLPKKSAKHKNHRAFNCHNEDLEAIRLGHRFQTDVARISIPTLKMSGDASKQEALSFMYAMLEGICETLEIERRDLNALLERNYETGSFDILVYDDVPGGAGLVKSLMSKKAIVASAQAALRKVSQNCCDEETSCYSCLRDYFNQSYHAQLKRTYAKKLLEQLIPRLQTACERLVSAKPADQPAS